MQAISSLQSNQQLVRFSHANNKAKAVLPQVDVQQQGLELNPKAVNDVVTFMSEANNIKQLDRKGWLDVGVKRPESVAAHSWSTAMLAMLLTPKDLDVNKTIKYAMLHDLAEAHVGDITPLDGISDEECTKLEANAMDKLCKDFPHLKTLWQEYEFGRTPEAKFCKQLDRLDMGIQAMLYSKKKHNTTEFIERCKQTVTHPVLKPVLDEVIRRTNIQKSK